MKKHLQYPINHYLQKPFLQIILIMMVVCFGIQNPVLAQVDPHFSQYYIQPMAMNPALTGAIDGEYRVSAIWRTAYGNSLLTKGLSAEAVTNKNANFGLNLLNETSSDGAYNYTTGNISYAYTGVRFGKGYSQYLVMALQCGFINRRFDVGKLQFGSQWTPGVGYEPSNNSGESFIKPSISTFDAGAGLEYYDATPNKKTNFFGGLSAYHLTQPTDPFLSTGNKERMPIRYCVQAGVRIVGSDLWSIVPSAIFMKEGSAEEKMIGAYVQLYASASTDLIVGANWRMQDAAIPFVGFYYKGLTMGVSYDANVSSMNTAANPSNSIEVSISFVGSSKSKLSTKAFPCPRF